MLEPKSVPMKTFKLLIGIYFSSRLEEYAHIDSHTFYLRFLSEDLIQR